MAQQFFRRSPLALLAIPGLVVLAVVLIVVPGHPFSGRARPTITVTPTTMPTIAPAPLGVRDRYATLQAPRAVSLSPQVTATTPVASAPVAIPRGAINIRGGPGMSYPVIGTADATSRLSILARDASGQWWQVQYDPVSSGRTWVSASVVNTEGRIDRLPIASGVP